MKYFTVWLNGYLESAIIIVHISVELKNHGKEFYLPKKFLFDRSVKPMVGEFIFINVPKIRLEIFSSSKLTFCFSRVAFILEIKAILYFRK